MSFANSNILVTGHTGFKGSWLTEALRLLGAKVDGLSDQSYKYNLGFYELVSQRGIVNEIWCDLRKYNDLEAIMHEKSYDYVFHLAAQPIVSKSFLDPLSTFETNIIGTANIINAVKNTQENCILVCVTSDKCYENVEWLWSYKETDQLGGKDPYSASKACAEIVLSSLVRSFDAELSQKNIKIGSGRAGNVIGGGDFAADRIIPDIIRSTLSQKSLEIRNPEATRPWQHVLEPISGYLTLAARLNVGGVEQGSVFNFGPTNSGPRSVMDVIHQAEKYIPGLSQRVNLGNSEYLLGREAKLLQLNCEKANFLLGWQSKWDFENTIEKTFEWYNAAISNKDVYNVSKSQIELYFSDYDFSR